MLDLDAGERSRATARALREDTFAGIDIVREAARGGMGIVYQGVELATGRTVAVKLLSRPELTDHARFLAEAEILERLATDTIVAYIAHGVTREGDPYLAMEWLEGETLAAALARRGGALALADAVAVARRIATALECAHALGIVHRDVKPSNVFLVGGMPIGATLIDFGIARRLDPSVQLTTTGQLVGTPGYMAPEQALGRRDLDGRVDLFALGCLLYQMLRGREPFPGGEVMEVLAKVLMHEPLPVVGDPEVPPRLASLVEALLAKQPEDRVATAALVEDELATIASALARDDRAALRCEPFRRVAPARSRRRTLVIAAATLAVATAASARVLWPGDRAIAQAEPCGDSAAEFASAWNPQRREALRAGPASAIAGSLEVGFDRYAASWIEQHAEACRATRVRGEHTEAMLDRRMACLRRKRQAFVAHLDVWSTSEAAASRGAAALGSLPPASLCANVLALRSVEPPPAAPGVRAELDELSRRLEVARVRARMGELESARADARAIVAAAKGVGYRAFEADAALFQGQVEAQLYETDAAIATLQSAVWAAEASRNDDVAARGWVHLVFLVGYSRGDHARAQELAQRTSAAVARLGGHADVEADLEQALAAIAVSQGNLDDAISHSRAAIPHLEKSGGPENPDIANARDNLATVYRLKGDARAAIEQSLLVLAQREREFDANHPLVGQALAALGAARGQLGESALAEADLRRALTIVEASTAPENPGSVTILADLARVTGDLGRHDEAIAMWRKVVAGTEKHFGSDHSDVAVWLLDLAGELTRADQLTAASAALARAETIFASPTSIAPPGAVAVTWVARGDVQLRRARWRDAIALYERALPILERSQGNEATQTSALTSLGIAHLRMGRAAQARAVLQAAHAGRERLGRAARGALDFALAQALSRTDDDRARARELANSALQEFGDHPQHRRERAEVMAWLTRDRSVRPRSPGPAAPPAAGH